MTRPPLRVLSDRLRGVLGHPNAFGFLLGVGRIVVLPQHLDVTAQRDDADAVLGLTPPELSQRARKDDRSDLDRYVKAEIELLALHAAHLGHQEMSQFVDEDHQPHSDQNLEDHPQQGERTSRA